MKARLWPRALLALSLIGPASASRAQDEPKPPVGEPSDPLRAAQTDLENGKFDDAIAKIEALVKKNPKDRQALFALTAVTQVKAQQMIQQGKENRKASIPAFLRSAEAARKLRESAKELNPRESMLVAEVLYNAACSEAIDGKADKAMATLKEAIASGFDKADLLAEDDELDALRKQPGFADLTKAIRAKAADQERKKAEAETRTVLSMMEENKPFPFKFSLPNLDDKKVSLDDYKGKVVIVDIWGTWCPPCRREIPHFVDLYKEYHDKGLEIVGINCNEEGSPAEVKKTIKEFLAENKVPYTCVVNDGKIEATVPDFEGYPTTLFLDRTGKVRLKLVGGFEKGALEAAVKKLLDEK